MESLNKKINQPWLKNVALFFRFNILSSLNRIDFYLFITLFILALSQSKTGIEEFLYIIKWIVIFGFITIGFLSIQIEKHEARFSLFSSKTILVLSVFLLYNFASLGFSIDIVISFFKTVTFGILLFISFFIIPKYVQTYKSKNELINSIYYFFTLFIILNFLFLLFFPNLSFMLFPAPRFRGFTENPNTIGIICFTSIPFFTYKFLTTSKKKKLYNLILILITVFFIFMAFSRASMLALAIIFATYFFYYNRIIFKLGIISAIILVLLLIFFPILLDLMRLAENPFSYRDQLLEVGFKSWNNHKMFGSGFGTSTIITSNRFIFLQKEFLDFNVGKHFGNIYFEVLVENGIFGFLIFITLLITLVKEVLIITKNSESTEKILNVGILGLVFAIIIQGFFESFLLASGNSASMVFWVLIGLTVQQKQQLISSKIIESQV